MAPSRKPRRRARRKRDSSYIAIPIQTALALGALANDTVTTAALFDLNDDVTVIAAELYFALRAHTEGEGPIVVGVSKSKYTVAQILENLDASPSHRSDDVAIEFANRRIRRMAQFNGLTTDEVPNDGKAVWARRLFWKLSNDDNLNFWAVNRDGGALTTGTQLEVGGIIHARWT